MTQANPASGTQTGITQASGSQASGSQASGSQASGSQASGSQADGSLADGNPGNATSAGLVGKALDGGVVIHAIESMTGAESIAPDHTGRGRPAVQGTQYVPAVPHTPGDLQREVENLLYVQAGLLDAKCWQPWIDLFTPDGVYWMPIAQEQTDWVGQPSIFAEDKLIMEIRMGRLNHPNAWSQAPMWGTSHLVGNVVIESSTENSVQVCSRFQMMELRRDSVRHFGGTYRHSLVRMPQGLRIALQRVDMMNGQAVYDYVLQAWV